MFNIHGRSNRYITGLKEFNKSKNQKYITLNDSLFLLISVKNKFNPSDKAIKIQNRLDEEEKKNNYIIIIWISVHIGNNRQRKGK